MGTVMNGLYQCALCFRDFDDFLLLGTEGAKDWTAIHKIVSISLLQTIPGCIDLLGL